MVKNTLLLAAIILLLASCSSIKPLQFTSNKQVATSSQDAAKNSGHKQSRVQFIDHISVTPQSEVGTSQEISNNKKETGSTRGLSYADNVYVEKQSTINVESANSLQLKYAILLNTEVEQLTNIPLLENIDEWYGTRYRLGGTTKKGIDCSAFVQTIFASVFGLSLPRTARDQYKLARRISRTELKEGDLLFFNTTGGISHVGIYLQNNKFVHASASKGVTVSDMFDPYYLRRFIAAGRVMNKDVASGK